MGANEAPPAILSAYIGEQLQDVVKQLLNGGLKNSKQGGLLGLGSPVLPDLPKHAGDRNRTSPFAFTGNKFEFRAVGSSQSVSFPTVVLNTIVAEAIDNLCTELESQLEKDDLEESLRVVLRKSFEDSEKIIFNGDGYSDEWQKEAADRGLLNLKTTADSLPHLSDQKNVDLFESYSVLNKRELLSRQEIWLEQYITTLNIEIDTTESIAKTMVYPSAIRYITELAEAVKETKALGITNSGSEHMLNTVNNALNDLDDALVKLRDVQKETNGEDLNVKARYYKENLIPVMSEIRDAVDFLERYVADDYWPLPIYREMLFVK